MPQLREKRVNQEQNHRFCERMSQVASTAGVVSLIHAYDPDLVVLGGGIAEASAQILPALQRYIDEHTWTLPRGRVRAARAELGDTAALLGIAALARGLDILL
jgi:glucokinase